MSAPEGRYALDLNSSAYADPYVCGTPYLPSLEDAERLADDLLPILADAGKWTLLLRATEEQSRREENQRLGYQDGSVWEQYGVQAPDYRSLIEAVAVRPGPSTDTDYRAWASVSSEARTEHDEPVYEENYGL